MLRYSKSNDQKDKKERKIGRNNSFSIFTTNIIVIRHHQVCIRTICGYEDPANFFFDRYRDRTFSKLPDCLSKEIFVDVLFKLVELVKERNADEMKNKLRALLHGG